MENDRFFFFFFFCHISDRGGGSVKLEDFLVDESGIQKMEFRIFFFLSDLLIRFYGISFEKLERFYGKDI